MQLTDARLWAPLTALCLLAFAAPGWAQDDDEPKTKVELKNDANGKGSSIRVKGQTTPLPDGTKLTVYFAARGKTRDQLALLRDVVVKGNAFEVFSPWRSRRLAPLEYRVRVELDLRKQPAAIRQWIMTEYGYGATHKSELQRIEVVRGTPSERTKFSLKNLEAIEALVLKLQALHGRAVDMTSKPAAVTPDWDTLEMEIISGMQDMRDEIDGYFRSYVVLVEMSLKKRLLLGVSNIARLLEQHTGGDAEVPEALADLGKRLNGTLELVRKMKPQIAQEPLVPNDEDEE